MDNIPLILPLIKELIMQYGLLETVSAFTISAVFIVLAWRLPNILTVIKDWKK
ncbi:hypothetical protein [Lonepinella sp. MS14436]|uniref:hypothetical protein n=1 Tax=Lonepinella sp. MS14436 TaxID=3003619 RepID=UPI0036D7F4F7